MAANAKPGLGSMSLMPFVVQIDPAGMTLHLERVAGVELGGLQPQQVLPSLKARGCPVDEDLCRQIARVLTAWRTDPQAPDRVLLKEGRPPKHGSHGKLEWAANCDPGRPHAEGENQEFSHYAARLVTVKAGDVIATAVPPTEGEPGVNVFGKPLPARNGKPAAVRPLAGCRLDRDTGQVVAEATGTLDVRGLDIRVTEGTSIHGNVDFTTGHVDSPGDVEVDGHVADLFHIRSGGSVNVREGVDAARIVAAGTITIGGCLANHRKGVCLAGGNIVVRIVDNSVAAARGDIIVHRQAVASDLFAGGAVRCEAGTISGGVLAARGGAHVKVLGSPGAAPMLVIAGVDWMLGRQTVDLIRRSEELDRQIQERSPAIQVLKVNLKRLTAAQKEKVTELEFEADQLIAERDGLLAVLNRLQEASLKATVASVTVTGQVNPGVEVRLGARVTHIDKPMRGPLTLMLETFQNQQVIVAKAPGGAFSPLRTGKIADPLEKVALPEIPPEPPAE